MSLNKEPYLPTLPPRRGSFLRRHRPKLVALAFWLIVVGLYWWYSDYYQLSPARTVKALADWFVHSIYGPPAFIIFFALQPLVFFPSFLLGIAGGILYGPILGPLYVILGANGAANVCYIVGRYFGRGVLAGSEQASGLLQRYTDRLRANTFETILIMHLLVVVPFDIVNYIAGFLRMKWKSFALATLIGAIPGIYTFVLFGYSLGELDKLMAGTPDIDLSILAISFGMMLVGVAISQWVKRREK